MHAFRYHHKIFGNSHSKNSLQCSQIFLLCTRPSDVQPLYWKAMNKRRVIGLLAFSRMWLWFKNNSNLSLRDKNRNQSKRHYVEKYFLEVCLDTIE